MTDHDVEQQARERHLDRGSRPAGHCGGGWGLFGSGAGG
jgi:hypothetical protein